MTAPVFVAFDVEADGPCPGTDLYSMVSIGLVRADDPRQSFYGTFRPISERFDPQALAVSGFTREQTLAFPDAAETTAAMAAWVQGLAGGRPVAVSDNPAFDWQFLHHYLIRFTGANPFGHSARRLGDLHAGWAKDLRNTRGWTRWRTTKHTHNALDDARGVAEGWQGLTRALRDGARP